VERVEAAHQSALEREYLGIDEVNRVPVECQAAMSDDGHRVPLLDQLVEVQVGRGAIAAVGFGRKRLLADEGLVAVECLPEYDSLRVSKSSRSSVLYRR
jgi:hypothetical protein